MIVKRAFIRHRVDRSRRIWRNYRGRKMPNVKEECVGWYLFGLIPLFVNAHSTAHLTDRA